ncbi:murein hydrolase activator EnvC family protein [Rhizobium sp. PAMB 3182]
MKIAANKRHAWLLAPPLLAGGLLLFVFFGVPGFADPVYSQEPPTDSIPAGGAGADTASPEDTAKALEEKREQTRAEMQALADSMKLSDQRAKELADSIAELEKTSASIKQALIESAEKRRQLEDKVIESEKKLSSLGLEQDKIRESLHERRGVLAEVLAALQRMGRNPPPALLVSPEDALASVRSAILLGAVVPGIRQETDKLVSALKQLTSVETAMRNEKANYASIIQQNLEEEKRMDLLLAENDRVNNENTAKLEAERKKSEELAAKATNLQDLIASLESEIGTLRDAKEAARAAEVERLKNSQGQTDDAKGLADGGLPDKNRIAPAYPFKDLKNKLQFPVAGDVVRKYGDSDGTGHPARGMTIATNAGMLVIAPADAQVVYAGKFRSYGQMIILDMGDGYHMILSGMDSLKTSQGKFVFAGEPLAVMGATRVASAAALALETSQPTLYIEFRHDGEPVDSAPWWTGKSTGKARNDT